MNPLLTIKGTLAVGFILALAVAFGMGNGLGGINAVIWLHVLAGVVWIGLLYYFNFVQVPGVAQALSEADNGGPGPADLQQGERATGAGPSLGPWARPRGLDQVDHVLGHRLADVRVPDRQARVRGRGVRRVGDLT